LNEWLIDGDDELGSVLSGGVGIGLTQTIYAVYIYMCGGMHMHEFLIY